MSGSHRWRTIVAGCATALALAACGGGSGSSDTPPEGFVPSDPGAPALTGNIALDGRTWINYRRSQIGMPQLTHNVVIDAAAQGHSEYQRTNNTVTHEQTPGKQGYTGTTLLDRLTAAGYQFANNNYAYGEVISATTNTSGFYMAEQLITAIYHRFVIFEPVFKEIGSGSATTSAGYTYFTSDFTANDGYGPGVGTGIIVTWPFNGQTSVPTNFFSDFESPDPVTDRNEVGYPISVHANIDETVTTQSFTVRPRGGSVLQVKLLTRAGDPETPASAAAIIPLSPLASATTYDVSFTGTVNGQAVSKSWSFTTK
jgi:uncharacterized protein YkwD